MSHQGGVCGQVHDELSRYFMCLKPEDQAGRVLDPVDDHKSMCRAGEGCFVRCEIEIPMAGDPAAEPLGYIVWVQVARDDYDRLLDHRRHENDRPAYVDLVAGTVANRPRGVAAAFGTAVKFAVVASDPTPYIKWIDPTTPLATLATSGATVAQWHAFAGLDTVSSDDA